MTIMLFFDHEILQMHRFFVKAGLSIRSTVSGKRFFGVLNFLIGILGSFEFVSLVFDLVSEPIVFIEIWV